MTNSDLLKPIPNRVAKLVWLTLAFCLLGLGVAQAQNQDAAVAWRLLDYIAVDYAGAVQEGEIISDAEYAEMREFSRTVARKLATLPEKPERSALLKDAEQLGVLVEQRASPQHVATAARTLGAKLIAAYPVPLAPLQTPDLARGAALYQAQCASCHGATGAGDGPAAASLDPAPVNFQDETRARERSLFALYQVISQGLEGTAMVSYASLPDEDRWALAFHVGGIAYPASSNSSRIDPAQAGDLGQLVQSIPSALAAQVGEARAKDVTAYLRHHPPAIAATTSHDQWAIVRARLDEAVAAHRRGDRSAARAAALSAYLDGFEPLEPLIAARQPALLREVEEAMLALRAAIEGDASADDVQALARNVHELVEQAEVSLARGEGNDWSTFLGALTILVREGLEALLIVIAMVAFLRKAQRPDVLKYVHAGWVGALALGVATWAVATYAVAISGAQREVVEGLSALLAAVVLVSVGLWLHQKSFAGRWQQYLKEKLSHALTQQSAWVLFGLSFIAVYREVFETILFYAAMWNDQGDNHAVIGGFLSGSLILALVTFAMLRFSRRLPIGQFFSLSSLLMAVLAVVLMGKGVAALQEAGWIGVAPIAMPRLDWLGVYPSWQTMVAQAVTLLVLVVGYHLNRRSAAATSAGAAR